ncbi:MAG: hypothetical protein WD063_20240 [Pirellulales bacterium]
MFLDAIHSELARLQVHPVNLGVRANDDRLIALRGSLLGYWKVPAAIDGKWFLGLLRGLPDAAGPEVVMNALCTAQPVEAELPKASEGESALRLFDPTSNEPSDGR